MSKSDLEKFQHLALQNIQRISAFGLSLVLCFSLLVSWYSWRDEKSSHEHVLTTVVELEAKAINNFLLTVQHDLEGLSALLVRSGEPINLDLAYTEIKHFHALHPELYNVTLIRPDGKVLLTARNPPGTTNATLAEESSFKEFLKVVEKGQNIDIGQPLVAVVSKTAIVPVRLAIRDQRGQPLYILSANLPHEYLRSFWKDAPITSKAAIGLMRDNGFLLARYPVPSKLSLDQVYGRPRTGALINHLQAAGFPSIGIIQGPSSLDGPDFLNAFRRLDNYPATLFVAMPMTEVWIEWWKRMISTYLALIFLVVGGIAARLYSLHRQREWNLEQTQLELANQESEERFRKLIEHNNAVIIQVAPESGKILDANNAAIRFYGWRREEFLTKNIQDINTLPAERVTEERQAAFREDRNYFVFTHRLANGEIRTVEVHSTPVPMDKHSVLVSIIHDISDRVRSAETVQDLLHEQTAILNSAIVGIVKLKNRHFVWTNAAFAQMLGYTTEELIGQPTRSIYPSDESFESFAAAAYPAMQRGEIFKSEVEYVRKDGSLGWYDVSGSMIDRSAGESIWAFTDISQRKAAENVARHDRTRLETILKTASDGIHILDISGRLLEANQVFLEMIGHDESVIGQLHVFDWDVALSNTDIQSRLDDIVRRRKRMIFETRHRRKDGQTLDVEINAAAIEIDGTSYLYASARDITERKKNESELAQYRHNLEAMVEVRTAALAIAKDAAETANRAKTTFLATMSHELRTPMNAIMGIAAILARKISDPQQVDLLSKLDGASKKLLAIINDILELTKIESDHLQLEPKDFILGELLDDLANLVETSAEKKGLEFSIDIAPALTAKNLYGDPLRLGQILLNLTSNAIKFTAQGAVRVVVSMTGESSGDVGLQFDVSDTGIGIAPEHVNRIFMPFEQVDGSMTRKFGGTGLGLSISQQLAHAMGGNIAVVSEPNIGSTFSFTIQIQKADSVANPVVTPGDTLARGEIQLRFAGARMLVVEDEPINQEVVKFLLEEIGLEVDLAGDGMEAVALARQHSYALILMDLQMPKMTGIDASKEIQLLRGHEATPIIATTANAFAEDRAACLAAGMSDYLSKPFEPDRLFTMLLKWLSKGR